MQLTRSTQQILSNGQWDSCGYVYCSPWFLACGIFQRWGGSESLMQRKRHVWPIPSLRLRKYSWPWHTKFQANKLPNLATSPRPVGSSASSTNSSTGQNPCTVLYKANGFPQSVFVSALFHYVRNKCDQAGSFHNFGSVGSSLRNRVR